MPAAGRANASSVASAANASGKPAGQNSISAADAPA
jgi:hypothetical protein